MEKKTIGISALTAILSVLIVLGGATVLDKNTYYCESSNTVMICDKFSPYYGLENGKCYNEKVGNKLCKSGWIEIKDDRIIENPVIYDTDIKQWLCSPEGCIPK